MMRRLIEERSRIVILSVGLSTFFFGFAAGAVVNLYLIYISSPLILQYRGALTFKSAIFGDGIVLPIINMVAASFLIKYKDIIGRKTINLALFCAALITGYFHVTQAVRGIVNWAMPTPWHWNILGLWHAGYMLAVAFLMSLFFIVIIRVFRQTKQVAWPALIVICGLVIFYVMLRADLS